jgi:DNA-binding GntR family transcriptional regulator
MAYAQTLAATDSHEMVERGTPLYEQVYNALWDKILNAEIVSGQRLSDREWAEQLHVSRTPVREAMRQMARDGVLLTLDNGGYQVRTVDPQGLRELYKCRAALEALAAREATLRGNHRLTKRLMAVIEKTSQALNRRDGDGALKCNTMLHQLIVEATGNEYLINLMKSLERLILFHRITLMKNSSGEHVACTAYFEHLGRVQEDHVAIANAVVEGRPDDAARLMEAHLLHAADDMGRLLRDPS